MDLQTGPLQTSFARSVTCSLLSQQVCKEARLRGYSKLLMDGSTDYNNEINFDHLYSLHFHRFLYCDVVEFYFWLT